MSFFILLWDNFSFLGINATSLQQGLIWFRLNYAAVALFLLAFYYFFIVHFIRLKSRSINIFVIVIALLFSIASIGTSTIIDSTIAKPWGIDIVPGGLNSSFNAFATILAISVIYYSIRKYRVSLSREKVQIQYFLIGTIIFIVFNIVFNVFLPTIGFTKYQYLGDYSSIFFLGFTAYAIIQRRLFGVRFLFQHRLLNSALSMFPIGLLLFMLILFEYRYSHGTARNSIIIALFFFAFFIYPFNLS